MDRLEPADPAVSSTATASEAQALADGDQESRDFAVAMAAIANETRGSDISVLHVAPLIYWTRYMVSGTDCCCRCSDCAGPTISCRCTINVNVCSSPCFVVTTFASSSWQRPALYCGCDINEA